MAKHGCSLIFLRASTSSIEEYMHLYSHYALTPNKQNSNKKDVIQFESSAAVDSSVSIGETQ